MEKISAKERTRQLEIDRVLICTTAHLADSDVQQLFEEETGLVVYEMGEYGYMILARELDADEQRQHSDNLEKLFVFAREQGCDWIRFDRDADEIEGFTVYDW